MLTNYHSHSHYCDGKGSLEEQVQGAIAQGLRAFGFSSHCPVPFVNQWSMKAERLADYLRQTAVLKEKYKDQIELYVGLEVDFLPNQLGTSDFPMLDYCVGSVHYVELNQFGQPWEIDGSSVEFLACLDTLYDGNIQVALEKYYGIIRQMVETDTPPIVGHLDKIKMHNDARPLFEESEEWYVALVEDTLEVIKKAGCIVEINTRGNYKRGLELYPSPWIIARMNELHIPICINSDSHRPEEITASFPLAFEAVRAAGYTHQRVLLEGKWQDVELN
ncbi:MAG: histidinol-phosphatase [Bacteroidetes bacterium]|nr:histidinol-phosphatase [Bacteroidota bacterium]